MMCRNEGYPARWFVLELVGRHVSLATKGRAPWTCGPVAWLSGAGGQCGFVHKPRRFLERVGGTLIGR